MCVYTVDGDGNDNLSFLPLSQSHLLWDEMPINNSGPISHGFPTCQCDEEQGSRCHNGCPDQRSDPGIVAEACTIFSAFNVPDVLTNPPVFV
jgi:hypothetical protein